MSVSVSNVNRGHLMPHHPDVKVYKFNEGDVRRKKKSFNGVVSQELSSNLVKITQYCIKDISCWKTVQALQTFGCLKRQGVVTLHVWHDQLKEVSEGFIHKGFNMEVNHYKQETSGETILRLCVYSYV